VEPTERSKKTFTKAHEAIRKEVECAFGMLKARFGILAQPSRLWFLDLMNYVMTCCIILHNMIIELRGDDVADTLPDPFGTESQSVVGGAQLDGDNMPLPLQPAGDAIESCRDESILAMCRRLRNLQDQSTSWSLREMLCRHYWDWNATQ